jgi:hypothetical protein
MKSFNTIVLFLCLLATSACANAWRTAYVGGATTAKLVTETHKEAWSDPLNDQAVICNGKLDPEQHTKADFDACMGPFAPQNNDAVLEALEVYNAAAAVLSEVLLATDPTNPDRSQLMNAYHGVLQAAIDLVALFPKGKQYVDRLEMLVKGL